MATHDERAIGPPEAFSSHVGEEGATLEALRLQLSLTDSIPGCMTLIIDKATRQIVACNELAREKGAVPGHTCFSTMARREDACPFCRASMLWTTGEPQEQEVEHEGSWRRTIWSPLSDTLFVHHVFDISERRRAEDELRLSRELFSSFLEHSPIYAYIKEVSSTESRVVEASDNFVDMIGVARRDMIGKTMHQLFPDDFAAKITADDWAVVSGGAVFQENEKLGDREYTTIKFPMDIGGKTLLAGYTIDVTDRMRSERAQAESERRLATLMANLPGMAYRCQNDKDWTMLFVSEGCEDLTGYPAARLVGNTEVSYADLIHPSDRETTWQTVQTHVAANEPFHLLYRIITADGTVKWAWERGRGVFDDAGHLLFLEGFITDVSEKMRAEEALKERDDQLRQSQKMEAVGQLAGGIAHDFNNLLAIILGYSDFLLADEYMAGTEARLKVEEIRQAADRAASLTNQILAFSRRQPLRPKVVSLNAVVTGMEALLRRTLGEDIEFLARLAPQLGYVAADVNQFEQVLMNLAVNARDAMSPGGRLEVETANVDVDEQQQYVETGSSKGTHVMLAVSDTGTGMDEAIRERVFEPFFTTKAPGSGTGLGLAMVYGIVKQSSGTIQVDSTPGHGSTFRLFLPSVDVPAEQETTDTQQTSLPIGRETVLLVEDEDALRALMTDVLSSYGFKVLSSATAGEALQLVEHGGPRPDVLVTDVVLPGGMQGNQLAEHLVRLMPDLPVLFVSGYSRDAIVHEGRLDPSVTLLQKPFSPKVLAETLREILNQQRQPRRRRTNH